MQFAGWLSSTRTPHDDDASSDPLVEAPSLRSQVYERLRQPFSPGTSHPGERISPTRLARRFGVSAMPIRDALRLLEQDGLVETAARRWTRVVELSPELVEELVPLASLLERYAVSSAATISEDGLQRLRRANAAFAAALERGDLERRSRPTAISTTRSCGSPTTTRSSARSAT